MALSDRLEHLAKKIQERRLEINPSLNKKKLKKEDTSKRITAKDEIGPNFREPHRASRTDFSDETIAPNMSKVNKPKADKPTKVTKKEVTVETPTGNIGSRSSFNEGEVNPFAKREAAAEKLIDYPSRTADEVVEKISEEKTSDEPSRFSASNPMGMKKGGSVRAKSKPKAKYMSSGGSTSSRASSRGDGCAQRGKTRGRMI
jgi:hypothetical protein